MVSSALGLFSPMKERVKGYAASPVTSAGLFEVWGGGFMGSDAFTLAHRDYMLTEGPGPQMGLFYTDRGAAAGDTWGFTLRRTLQYLSVDFNGGGGAKLNAACKTISPQWETNKNHAAF
ncbi:unnamed protein product [Pleuronectes platessa]|uniref:Uncharacterized protein n=1 Tax=Pleuronectes platessa TaxID=8262 RepID=A0A9N7VZ38_PLEPL|nr:unnamed protein product [Pleuronectes platessa]